MLTTSDLLQRLFSTLPEHTWLARLVEVAPGVRDAQIFAVTPGLERLLGFYWPDTLIGAYMSQIHLPDDTYRVRQYAALRMCGVPVATEYMLHLLHPSGRIIRVVKHVDLRHLNGAPCWVTHHAHSTATHTSALPDPTQILQQHPDAQRVFAAASSMADALLTSALSPVLTCHKCGYTWYRRQAQEPRQCPHCKNPQWHQPRQRQRRSRHAAPPPRLT